MPPPLAARAAAAAVSPPLPPLSLSTPTNPAQNQELVVTLLASLPQLLDVLILCAFIFLIFGIVRSLFLFALTVVAFQTSGRVWRGGLGGLGGFRGQGEREGWRVHRRRVRVRRGEGWREVGARCF